jgi:hypothetical protein
MLWLEARSNETKQPDRQPRKGTTLILRRIRRCALSGLSIWAIKIYISTEDEGKQDEPEGGVLHSKC